MRENKWERRERRRRREGSKGIKTEISKTCVIAQLSHINTDRVTFCENKCRQSSMSHVLPLRCLFHLWMNVVGKWYALMYESASRVWFITLCCIIYPTESTRSPLFVSAWFYICPPCTDASARLAFFNMSGPLRLWLQTEICVYLQPLYSSNNSTSCKIAKNILCIFLIGNKSTQKEQSVCLSILSDLNNLSVACLFPS